MQKHCGLCWNGELCFFSSEGVHLLIETSEKLQLFVITQRHKYFVTLSPTFNIDHPYIGKKVGLNGGAPVIKNTRMAVSFIAELERFGTTVDEMIVTYPHRTHAQIFDALSYYYDNQSLIDKKITNHDNFIKEVEHA